MNCLVLETSTRQASVALFSGQELLVDEIFPGGRSAVSPLFSILDAMLKRIPVIDEIVVGVGPGSYSGIRIGISAAIGLQLARNVVAHGVHSAMGFEGTDFQVVLDARGSWVFSKVRAGRLIAGPVPCSRKELDEIIDPALHIYWPDNQETPVFPRAAVLGRRLIDGTLIADLSLQPLYLKPPHITPAKALPKI